MATFTVPNNVGSCLQFHMIDSPVMNQLKAAVRRSRPVIPRSMSTTFMPDLFVLGLVGWAVALPFSVLVSGTRLRTSFSAMVLV